MAVIRLLGGHTFRLCILIMALALFSSDDCLTNLRNPTYELIVKDIICTSLDSELVFNVTCHHRRINQTANHHGLDLNFRPGVIFRTAYVIYIHAIVSLLNNYFLFVGKIYNFQTKYEYAIRAVFNN